MEIFEKSCIATLFFILGYVPIAKGADIRCYNGTFDNYLVYSLDDPTPLLNSSFFELTRKTVVYIFGNDGKATGPSVKRVVEAYLSNNTANICLLNWEQEASSGILGPISYPTKAIPNAKTIGVKFGKALIKLHEAGLNLTNVHLVGFSLGAHLSSYSGVTVQEKGYNISRITGLDPAGPFYDGILSLHGLSGSDASFVDIVHGNNGRYGTNEDRGAVDFWPNCESSVQPGCDIASIGLFSNGNLCSHDRSWQYFAEAVERPTAFEARFATGCNTWKAGRGTNKIIYMGDYTDTEARGNFYLRTNSASLYGIGEEGSQPVS